MSSRRPFDPVTSALAFVDLLVPGSFERAKALLAPTCEYHYGGNTLRGDAIIAAFEESHAKAKAQLDSIVYLPGRADHVEDATVTVRVFDRLGVNDAFHTYSDRLVITVLPDEEATASPSSRSSTGPSQRSARSFRNSCSPRASRGAERSPLRHTRPRSEAQNPRPFEVPVWLGTPSRATRYSW